MLISKPMTLLAIAATAVVVACSTSGQPVPMREFPTTVRASGGPEPEIVRIIAPSPSIQSLHPWMVTPKSTAPSNFLEFLHPRTDAAARAEPAAGPINPVAAATIKLEPGQSGGEQLTFPSGSFDPNCGSLNWNISGLPTSGVTSLFSPSNTTPTGTTDLNIGVATASTGFGVTTFSITAMCTGTDLSGNSAGGVSQTLGIYDQPPAPAASTSSITVAEGQTGTWNLTDAAPSSDAPLQWQASGLTGLSWADASTNAPFDDVLSVAVGPTASPGNYEVSADVVSNTSYGQSEPVTLYLTVVTPGPATPTPNPTPTGTPTATPTASPQPTSTPTASPKPTATPPATPSPVAVPGGYVIGAVTSAQLKIAQGSTAAQQLSFASTTFDPNCGNLTWSASNVPTGVTTSFSPSSTTTGGTTTLTVSASTSAHFGLSSLAITATCTGSNLKGTASASTTESTGVYALPTLALNDPPYNVPWVAQGGSRKFSVRVGGATNVFPITWGTAGITGPLTLTLANGSASAPGSTTLSIVGSSNGNPQLYQAQNFVTATSTVSYGMASVPLSIYLAPPGAQSPAPIATPSTVPSGCVKDLNYPWARFCAIDPNTPVTLPIWTFVTPPIDISDKTGIPDVNEACAINSAAFVYPIATGFTVTASPGPSGPQPCLWRTRFVGSVTVSISPSVGAATQLIRLNTNFELNDPDDSNYNPAEFLSSTSAPSQNGYEIGTPSALIYASAVGQDGKSDMGFVPDGADCGDGCVYTVNGIVHLATGSWLCGSSATDNTDVVKKCDNVSQVTDGSQAAGDLVIVDSADLKEAHIGICLNSGCTQMNSNSSQNCTFTFDDENFDYPGSPYTGGTVTYWRVK